MSEEDRTVWVGNLDPESITEDILYELFLQAGPLHYVRIPKDKESGRLKSFGFVCFKHDVSVPYAIELFKDIKLFGRSIKVQNRSLQERQRQGLVMGPVGVHTLKPDNGEAFTMEPPRHCGQESLMGEAPYLSGIPWAMMNSHMMPVAHQQKNYHQQGQQQSLLGSAPNFLRNMRGRINSDIIAAAQQQMALLNANQPVLLTNSPTLNVFNQPTSHRSRSEVYGTHRDDNYHRNKNYEDNRNMGGRPRSIDNAALQDFKSRFDQDREDNAHRASDQQQRKGNFDFSRLGHNVGYDSGSRHNDNRYHDSSSRRNDNCYHASSSKHDDRYNRYDNHSQGRHGKSHHHPYSRNGSRI